VPVEFQQAVLCVPLKSLLGARIFGKEIRDNTNFLREELLRLALHGDAAIVNEDVNAPMEEISRSLRGTSALIDGVEIAESVAESFIKVFFQVRGGGRVEQFVVAKVRMKTLWPRWRK
jgi:hypothetical protein